MKQVPEKKNLGKELTERQKVILEIITQDPFTTAKAVAEKVAAKTAVTDKTVLNDIARLKKMGILTRKGCKEGKWTVTVEEA